LICTKAGTSAGPEAACLPYVGILRVDGRGEIDQTLITQERAFEIVNIDRLAFIGFEKDAPSLRG
jgi:hypothetical protein